MRVEDIDCVICRDRVNNVKERYDSSDVTMTQVKEEESLLMELTTDCHRHNISSEDKVASILVGEIHG